jgi:hypothetical protein
MVVAMPDGYRDLHRDAYREWKQQAADDYAQAQRRAFLDGFETAAKESREFNLLRTWLEEQRDEAERQYREQDDDQAFTRRMTFIEVLVKLSEMGCHPSEDGDSDE